MHTIPLADDLFQGHVELERGDGWVKPWRLPHARRALFPSPGDDLMARAETASGVRLRFATAATRLRLGFLPLPMSAPAEGREGFHFDATIDGELIASAGAPPGLRRGGLRGAAGRATRSSSCGCRRRSPST